MISPLYTASCFNENYKLKNIIICTDWAIYSISIVLSLASGTLHAFLNFGVLYYLTNISNKNEKQLFYCAF